MKHLTSLVHLTLHDLPKLTASSPEWMQHLTMLQTRMISNLPSLPEWLKHLPSSLQQLEISFCGSIKSLPAMGMLEGSNASPSSLVKLTSLSEGLRHLTSLKELSIMSCPDVELETMDFHNLISLETLKLNTMLTSLPEGIQHIQRLQLLEIHNLTSLSEGLRHLTSLKELSIKSCPDLELKTLDFHNLLFLETLELNTLPQVTSLPEGIQHLPRLQTLSIWDCENLQTLPQWIKHLTTLQYLWIINCHPELHAKCNKENGGEYWPLISHIPNIDIFDNFAARVDATSHNATNSDDLESANATNSDDFGICQ